MASTSDTTPLLADSEPLGGNEYQNEDNITSLRQKKEPCIQTTVGLTILSVVFSVIAFLFDLIVIAIDAANPHGYYLFWGLRSRLHHMFGISILTLIFSPLNLASIKHSRRPLWLWVNLIVDGVTVVYVVSTAPEALSQNFNQSPDSWLPDNGAANTARAVTVLLAIGLISGLLVAFVHLILFPVRCYASLTSGSWQTPQSWRVPGGEFKIEFSIKFLRQEERRESLLEES
ncbi:hypothetical protein BJX63DRAFT_428557 [Aspergillus granulosus]|uniref:Uncharacterized protein n=1 Tax=Aspergillus granulosus TaxID=176169 RepID=A0ABR4HYM0_9EURO